MTFPSQEIIPQAQERIHFDNILIWHLARKKLFSGVAVDMGAEEDASSEGFATVGANMG